MSVRSPEAVAAPEPRIELPDAVLPALVAVPTDAVGVVAFAHGSDSSRLSPRNRLVASFLNGAGIATLLFDLLTPAEALDRRNVFDVELLAQRLEGATRWLGVQRDFQGLPVGYFGASTGAAAALWAAADLGEEIKAVVSRGGRPDLAAVRLGQVGAATLLIVGGYDDAVLGLNRSALALLPGDADLQIVPRATHLFEEAGALERVAVLASGWFLRHLQRLP